MILASLALSLIILDGPDNQKVFINPAEVVTVRRPRGTDHFDPNVRCLLHMADGKFVAVVNACDEVINRLLGEDED